MAGMNVLAYLLLKGDIGRFEVVRYFYSKSIS